MPSEEHRTRSSKPLMEKRRRARINESLLQLKNLVLDALNKNNPRHSKLEKADILEMTVRYLRSMNRQQIARTAPNNDPIKLSHYRTGFAECMNEVSRYLGTSNPNSNANNNNTTNKNVAPTCSSNSRDSSIISNQHTAEIQVRLQLMNHLASQCSSTAQESTGLKKPQHQIADVTLSSPSTSGVQPMQVDIGGATASTSSSSLLQGCQAPEAEADKRGNELNRLCTPVVNNSPTAGSRPLHVVTVEPRAYTSASQAVPMTGNEITLVLPHHLVQSGQIPTHLIPVYAASPPVCSPTPPQISPAFIPSAPLSSPSHVTLYPVAPSNVHITSPVGGTTGSGDGALLPCSSSLPIYPHESNSTQASITLTTPLTNFSLSQLYQSPITSSSSSSPSSSSLSSMSSTPSTDSQATSSPPSPPPPHPPLSLGFHTPTFSPVAIALPIHARIIPASPTTAEQNHFELHPIIPFQATMATPPNHPAIPTPPNPDPQAAADADSGREHRDVDNRGINEEVKIAPTWRPW